MLKFRPSHFELWRALCTSFIIVMGVITKPTYRERFRNAIRCFAWFMGTVFVVAWLMYLGDR